MRKLYRISASLSWDDALPAIKKALLAKVTVDAAGCWIVRTHAGSRYGEITVRKRKWRMHVLSYTVYKGPVPKGMEVCHACDVTECCNPDHLWLGTHRQNHLDSLEKGRHSSSGRTHCRNGHEYAVYAVMRSDGAKRCTECDRQKHLAYRLSNDKPHPKGADHCRRGHPYTEQNTYLHTDGRRRCKQCRYDSHRRFVLRNAARPPLVATDSPIR